jgi:hypothetical protein
MLHQAIGIFYKKLTTNKHNISIKSLIFLANPATRSKKLCFLSHNPALESFNAASPSDFC